MKLLEEKDSGAQPISMPKLLEQIYSLYKKSVKLAVESIEDYCTNKICWCSGADQCNSYDFI